MIILLPLANLLQDPIATDRPDFTESNQVVSVRQIQMEFGITYTYSGDRQVNLPETLVRYGIADRLELRLETPQYFWNINGSAEGYSGPAVGAKLALGETLGWGSALIGMVELPTGSAGIRSENPQGLLIFTAGRDLGAGSIATQIALSMPFDTRASYQHTLVYGFDIAMSWGAFGEIVSAFGEGRPGYLIHFGFTHQPSHDEQWDIHIGLPIAGTDRFVGMGYAMRF